MKKIQVAGITLILLAVAGGVAYGVFTLSRQALTKQDAMVECRGEHTDYVVTIMDSQLSINDVHAKLCDTLTIVNADDHLRLIAFGVHDRHQTYGNNAERTLLKDQRMTVTLEQRGTYTFHDHLDEQVKGTFTVE